MEFEFDQSCMRARLQFLLSFSLCLCASVVSPSLRFPRFSGEGAV